MAKHFVVSCYDTQSYCIDEMALWDNHTNLEKTVLDRILA